MSRSVGRSANLQTDQGVQWVLRRALGGLDNIFDHGLVVSPFLGVAALRDLAGDHSEP